MAKVNGTFYTAQRLRRDTTPVSPPYDGEEGQQPPVNPSVRTTPPVAIRYASEVEMIADQINQRSGYLYFDGTNTWWYKGVANGVIGDYQEFGRDFDDRYVRKDIDDTKKGQLSFLNTSDQSLVRITPNGTEFDKVIETLNIDGTVTFSLNRQGSIEQNSRAGGSSSAPVILEYFDVEYFRFRNNNPSSGETNLISARFINRAVFEHSLVSLQRSFNSIGNTRRDEQRLFYLLQVNTAGSINDQALTDGMFNYRFTLATSITGFANGEIGRSIIIQNDNTVNLDLTHEDVSSIAANRMNLIGGGTLSIPTKGKVTLIYCTGSRWELLSKNF